MLTVDEILKAAKIGESRCFIKDPAIDRDDVFQIICLRLLKRDDINCIELAIHVAKHIRPQLLTANVKARECRHEPIVDDPQSNQTDVLRQLVKQEEDARFSLAVCNAEITAFQRKVINHVLNGFTPLETANQFGTSYQVICNCITSSVKAIRKQLKIYIDGPVKLGRCSQAQITDRCSREINCVYCGSKFAPKRLDAKYCGYECRYKARWDKSYQSTQANRLQISEQKRSEPR